MQQKLKELKILADKSFHLCSILNDYCKNHSKIEEISNLHTLIEYLYDNIDKLSYMFVSMDSDDA